MTSGVNGANTVSLRCPVSATWSSLSMCCLFQRASIWRLPGIAIVFPYRSKDDSAREFAMSVDAELAVSRGRDASPCLPIR